MTRNERDRAEALEVANRVKALGFRVWIAERGTYGFISDAEGSRVLSWSADGPWSNLSGNYGPPSQESGTGWKLDGITLGDLTTAEAVKAALYAYPPAWCGKGWKSLTTVEQHLKLYQSSSAYVEV